MGGRLERTVPDGRDDTEGSRPASVTPLGLCEISSSEDEPQNGDQGVCESTRQSRPDVHMRPINSQAAMVGTPAQEIKLVKATLEGKMVQSKTAETIPMKMTALRGCPFLSTFPIQADPGRIPSRAMAETRREAATMAIDMFCWTLE